MEFIIKFAQTHETFRVAEIESLAVVEKLDLKIIEYDADVSLSQQQVFF
jgi:tRNA (guanine10-N2)-methyltransferase